MSNLSAIIVAGGRGLRYGSPNPKQFLKLKGKPILIYSLEAFRAYDAHCELILVLPTSHIELAETILNQWNVFDCKLVEGGETRYDSVAAGLVEVNSDGVIAVHDAVRPLITAEFVESCVSAAKKYGSAVPVAPVNQSLRKLNDSGSSALIRSEYVYVQTPQCFKADILKRAYETPYQPSFTDDASVVEAHGTAIHTIDGLTHNLKITEKGDILIAEALMP